MHSWRITLVNVNKIAVIFTCLFFIQTASAQMIPGDAVLVQCRVTSGSLAVVGGDPVLIAGLAGKSYNYFFIPSNESMTLDPPDASGNAHPGDLVWYISGAAAQTVIFDFSLPHSFTSASTGAAIPISYDNFSANYVDQNGNVYTWNPISPSPSITIGPAGTGTLYLGFIFSVPSTAPPSSDYLAYFYMAAHSTGF
jgi:hypothetical protein